MRVRLPRHRPLIPRCRLALSKALPPVPFQVDDRFFSHPKILAISLAARGLWVSAGSWSSGHRKGGVVPDHVLATLGSTPELEGELLKVGLWERIRRGVRFHDWDHWNETPEQVERRQAEAERKKELAAERQRRKRAKAREAEAASVTPVTRDVTRDTPPDLREPAAASRSRHAPESVTVTRPGYTGKKKPQVKATPVTRDISVTACVTGSVTPASDDLDSDQSLRGSVKSRSKSRAREPKPRTTEFRLQVRAAMAAKVREEISDDTADAIADEVLGGRDVPHKLSYVLTAIEREKDPWGRWLAGRARPSRERQRLKWCGECEETDRATYDEQGRLKPCPRCAGYAPAWEEAS